MKITWIKSMPKWWWTVVCCIPILIIAGLFAQVPAKKLEQDPKSGGPFLDVDQRSILLPPSLHGGDKWPLKTHPQVYFFYTGGVGKDGRMWPIERVLDEKLAPILKAIPSKRMIAISKTINPYGEQLSVEELLDMKLKPLMEALCIHEWEDGPIFYQTQISMDGGKTLEGVSPVFQHCKKCGLLRIKK